MSEQFREILKKAEIKRVGERLTKKEICTIYGLNYNFYMNCVSGRNLPSKKMAEQLDEYLGTPTSDIYELVFAFREKETDFHQRLNISDTEAKAFLKELRLDKIFREPKA